MWCDYCGDEIIGDQRAYSVGDKFICVHCLNEAKLKAWETEQETARNKILRSK